MFDSLDSRVFFTYANESIPTVGPTTSPTIWIPRALPGCKQSGRDFEYSPPSTANDGKVLSCTSINPVQVCNVVIS
jgi:hypothetical protein